MKFLFIAVVLLSTSVFAQVSEEQVKNFSFAGDVVIGYDASHIELWKDQLTLETENIADFVAQMKDKGVEVLSGVYANEKTGLIVATVKLLQKENQLSVMVFDSTGRKMYFYNISEISPGLIVSKDDHYSDLTFKVSPLPLKE